MLTGSAVAAVGSITSLAPRSLIIDPRWLAAPLAGRPPRCRPAASTRGPDSPAVPAAHRSADRAAAAAVAAGPAAPCPESRGRARRWSARYRAAADIAAGAYSP